MKHTINRQATLLVLSPGFPASELDTVCMPFPALLVKTLGEHCPNLEIIVLSFQYPFTRGEYEWNDATVIAFNGQNRGQFRRLMIWNSVYQKIKQLSKDRNIVGVLSLWLGECALIGKWAGKKLRVPSFTWLLGQDARKGNRYYSFTRPRPGSLIALSDFLADHFQENYGIRPAHIITPGIGTAEFPPLPGERDIDILAAGSLIPLKRYELFVELVARLVESHPSLKAVICGQGLENKRLIDLMETERLSRHIHFAGEVDHGKLLGLMQRSRIFVHPSSYEGFSTAVNEALYAGCEVFSFTRPMRRGYHHLHIVKNMEELVERTNYLLNKRKDEQRRVLTAPIEETCSRLLALYGLQFAEKGKQVFGYSARASV